MGYLNLFICIDAALCGLLLQHAWSVCLSVSVLVTAASPAKTDKSIEGTDTCGPKEPRGDKKGKGSPAILKNVRLATTQTFFISFLPRDAMLCYASHDPVSVRLSVRHKSVFY